MKPGTVLESAHNEDFKTPIQAEFDQDLAE